MSQEVRRVKLLVLLSMALGLVLVVLGIINAMSAGDAATPYFVLCGEGVLTLVYGARAALVANVPARIGKLATLALIVLLLQLACVAGIVYLIGVDTVKDNPVPVAIAGVPALLNLIECLLARGIAKRAER